MRGESFVVLAYTTARDVNHFEHYVYIGWLDVMNWKYFPLQLAHVLAVFLILGLHLDPKYIRSSSHTYFVLNRKHKRNVCHKVL